ncbi:MAG: hypothetical protein ABIO38_07560 [Luteimonas sp.]
MRIALLLLSTTLFASCSCQRDAEDAPATATQKATQPSEATKPAVDEAELQQLARLQDQRYAAFSGAASTVQSYLAAVGARDWKKADGFWVNQSPGTGEADLRSVKTLQSLRIENETPEALDKEAVPKALQVPVNLRANVAGGEPTKRYRGWYRVRQKVSGEGWEITSASIDAVPR